MKRNRIKIGLTLLAAGIFGSAFGQDSSQTSKPDTTRFDLGEGELIYIKRPTTPKEAAKRKAARNNEAFKHLSGLALGVNGYTANDNVHLPDQYKHMTLDYAKSISIIWNIYEERIPLGTPHVAISTGVGIQWNRYAFRNNTLVDYDSDSLMFGQLNNVDFKTNVLKATYVQVPLILEFNTSKNADKSVHLAGGIIGSFRLGSKTKLKYEQDGKSYKDKKKGHYHLNSFPVYATARVGYGGFTLFANYGLNQLFENGAGPALTPFTVGLNVIDW